MQKEDRYYFGYHSKLVKFARDNRKNPTSAEKVMWNLLCRKQFAALKFTRQKPIDNFIVDFYCSELRLAIEIDGESHALQENYDQFRGQRLKKNYDIDVIRYTNSDVLDNLEGVYTSLELYLKNRHPIHAGPPPVKGELEGVGTREKFEERY
jgi:very-short-patch-repair endonuclease